METAYDRPKLVVPPHQAGANALPDMNTDPHAPACTDGTQEVIDRWYAENDGQKRLNPIACTHAGMRMPTTGTRWLSSILDDSVNTVPR